MGQKEMNHVPCLNQKGNVIAVLIKSIFRYFSAMRRKAIVKNRIAHIVEIIIKIKKDVWKKCPSVEAHTLIIFKACEVCSKGVLDQASCEIVCAANLFIVECLKNDISNKSLLQAKRNFDHFKNHSQGEITKEVIHQKFEKWFSLGT